MWKCRGGEEKVINFIQNAKKTSHPARFKMEEIVTSNIFTNSKDCFSRSCLLMLLNHRSEDLEHRRRRIEGRGSRRFRGHHRPSNRSLLVPNFSNGITHVWSVCAMELMDSSRKNSFWSHLDWIWGPPNVRQEIPTCPQMYPTSITSRWLHRCKGMEWTTYLHNSPSLVRNRELVGQLKVFRN